MCDCIEKVKDALNRKMQEERGFTEIVEEVDFVNHSIYPTVKPYFPTKGKYRQGKRVVTFKISVYPTYCPFCGEKIDD
jgi:hypothetical protein